MEEAAEAQERVCEIHYKQMEKADRDPLHAMRAEDECRQLLAAVPQQQVRAGGAAEAAQYPGSAGRARVCGRGCSITTRAASRPRPTGCTGRWTNIRSSARPTKRSGCWGIPIDAMGDRFEDKAAAAYTRIVKDYPLSAHARRCQAQAGGHEPSRAGGRSGGLCPHEVRAGKPDGSEQDHRRFWTLSGGIRIRSLAAKSGSPTMTVLRPAIPVSVPQRRPRPAGRPGATGGGRTDRMSRIGCRRFQGTRIPGLMRARIRLRAAARRAAPPPAAAVPAPPAADAGRLRSSLSPPTIR